MREPPGQQPLTRPGNCANHTHVPSVASCAACGRAACLACVLPVRGRAIGRECLSKVLADDSVPESAPPAVPPPVHRLAAVGFALVLVVSIFPWSRFGDSSWFGAWKLQWSLLAAVSALVGLTFALVRPRATASWVEPAAYLALGAVVAGSSVLHLIHPPPLSAATASPWLAIVASGLVLFGGVAKALWLSGPRRGAA